MAQLNVIRCYLIVGILSLTIHAAGQVRARCEGGVAAARLSTRIFFNPRTDCSFSRYTV